MTDPQLVSFVDFDDKYALASRLSALVTASRDRLKPDFPGVPQRYRDTERAFSNISQVCTAISDRGGDFNAFAVVAEDAVVGVGTCERRALTSPKSWMLTGASSNTLDGMLIAVWLGSVERPRNLLPGVLRSFAAYVAYSGQAIVGPFWTLVRPNRPEVEGPLADASNGFGGFVPLDKPRDYRSVDGVSVRRQLYTSQWTGEHIRGE